MAVSGLLARRVPGTGQTVEEYISSQEWTTVHNEKRRVKPSISDFPGVLRLPKRNYDVPTLDQLWRREKIYLLRSYGFGCIETENTDQISVIKQVELIVGQCSFFNGLKTFLYQKRKTQKAVRKAKKLAHVQRQHDWLNGGQAAKYMENHRFGDVSHPWFAKALEREVGMKPDLSEDTCEPFMSSWDVPSRPRSRWSRADERSDQSQELWSHFYTPAFVPPTRSIMLLTKLRAYIRLLRSAPMNVWNKPTQKYVEYTTCAPQMEGLAGETPAQISTGNTVLVESNPASTSTASMPVFKYDWHQLCTTEKKNDYSYLTDRFTYYKTFTWKKSYAANTQISDCSMDLPVDFVDSVAQDGSMPMFVPFKIHQYFKSDIEIKFHVNSNKFQVGQLQFSWQYMEKYDGNPMDNMYVRSQLPHVLVNAGSSNEATLRIPFKYVVPYMTTRQRKRGLARLYLGSLKCYVVAPLAVGASGPDSCNVSIFIRLPNCDFTGMRDGSIAEPEMEAAIGTMVAGAVLDKVIGDFNCDNPSNNVNPQYLVPTASHSWSAGTGITEQVHGLRLDNSTVSVGRTGIDNSETNLSIPCRTFGMLKHFEWSKTDASKNVPGHILWSADVNAQISKDLVYKMTPEDSLDCYSLPPVSVIASLFKQWRGSLEFRFDIIASQFHTGRLLCAYIPGYYGDPSKVTIQQARNSPCVEFSLQDSTSFTFITPYIANNVFWDRKYTGPHKYGEHSSPSKLILYILNPLIPMESIVDKVTIVPYVRAGVDFEVSVPVQPAIGLSDNPVNMFAYKDYIYPTQGSTPYRCTNYEGFGADKKYIFYEGTAALGTAATFTAPPKKLGPNEAFYGEAEDSTKQPAMLYKSFTEKDAEGKYVTKNAYASFIALWNVPDKGNYGIPFPSGTEGEAQAKKVAKMLKQGANVTDILKECYDYIADGTSSATGMRQCRFKPRFIKWIAEEDSDWESGSPEMEDQRTFSAVPLQSTQNLPSTSGGAFNFNERFVDLKDLARRYQLYAEKNITIKKGYNSSSALCVFPAIPHGLSLDVSDPQSVFNICRDGHIPIISSGYIYYRGSIRFKLVLSSDSPTLGGAKIWVQHHPDGDCRKHEAQYYPNIEEEDSFKSHSYAYYIQAMSINSIIEFEVPFYQPGMYGLLRKPSKEVFKCQACEFYTLGNIAFGAYIGSLDKNVDFNVQIYYSIGDDFSFSTFRGFHEMVFTDEVWPPSSVEKRKKKEIVWITGEPEMEEAQPEMMKSLASYFLKDTVTSATEELSDVIKQRLEEEVEQVRAKFHTAFNNTSRFVVNTPTVVAALGNLVHVLANPEPKTIAISVANVLASLLASTVVNLLKFVEAITALLSDYWDRFTGFCSLSGKPESAFDDNKSAFVFSSLVFTTVASICGAGLAGPSSFPDVLKNINGSVSLLNNVIRLVQNSSDLIVYCVKYIGCKLYPDHEAEIKLVSHVPEIKQWYMECIYLLDVRNKSKYLYDRSMMSRVFDASVVGNILISSGIGKNSPAGKLIYDTQKEIRKLQIELFERGAHPDVRFEVFPLWLSGSPGIGKSFMVKRLVNDLLAAVGYNAPGSLIYDIPSGAKYWSGCQNPAALVSDDLFQVTGTKLEDEIANIFLICSSSVLNPPMAAVEDKERRLNPLLYIMLCNSHFPNLSPTCTHPEAVYRRRKFLIQAELNEEVCAEHLAGVPFKDASQLPRHILSAMAHIKFKLAYNVKDPSTKYSEYMTYNQLLDVMKPAFIDHYKNERENFKQRMIDMYCLDPDFEETNIITELPAIGEAASLTEQIEAFKNHIRDELDRYNDPTRDKVAWDYVRMAIDNFSKLKNKFQMEEPSDGASHILETNEYSPINGLQLNYPELDAAVKKCINKEYLMKHGIGNPGDKINFENITNFAGTLASEANVVTEVEVDNLLEEVLDLNNPVEGWYAYNMRELLEIGNFDLIEKIKFICMFENGPLAVAKLLTKVGPCNVLVKGFSFNSEYEQSTLAVKETADYHNIHKKKQFRAQLQTKLRFLSNKQYYYECMKALYEVLLLEPAIKSGIKSPVTHYITNDYVIQNYHPYDFYVSIKRIIKDQKSQENSLFDSLIIKNCLQIIVLQHIFSYMFLNCCCVSTSLYPRAVANPKLLKFCDVRHKLEYLSNDMTVCKAEGCIFNNDLLYYILSLAAVSCKTKSYVCSGRFGAEVAITFETGGIKTALRKRAATRSENIFARFGRWCKHIFFHSIPDCLSLMVSIIMYRLPYILASLVMGTGLMIGTSIYRNCYPATEGAKQANYFKFDNPKYPVKPKIPTAPKAFAAPQMSANNRVVLSNKITQNTALLYVTWIENGERQVRSCRNLMLRGRAMLVLRHYLEEYQYLVDQGFQIECKLFFNKAKTGICQVAIPWKDICSNVAWCSSSADKITSNFGIVALPTYIPAFKDIVKHFASLSEHQNIPSSCDLYVINGESSFGMPTSVKKNFLVSGTKASSPVYIDRVYSYSKQFKGLCGSVLVGPTLGSGLGAIIGIHVAGNEGSGIGYSEPIYKDMLLQFFNEFPEVEVMPIPLDDSIKPDFELDSNLMTYGCVPPTFAHKESGKSKIIPSLLHGVIYPVKTEPNPLQPNDPRQPPGSHPLRDGCNKHGSGDVKPFDPDLVADVKEHLSDRLQQIIRPIRAEVTPLSLSQAIVGDVNVPYFEPLTWKSSEGFPLSSSRPKSAHDKKWLFDLQEGEFGYKLNGINSKLEMQLALRDKCFKANIKPPTIYIDCLKDYRLTPKKCAEPGKTRIFSIAPIQCSIDCRMYINDFCASLKNTRIINGIAIGINCSSLEWTTLVNYLFEVGNKIITLDYKNFGPCLMSQLVASSADVIVEWHKYHGATDEHCRRVKWILENDIINPVHLSSNLVYQTVNGISSGSPLTGECNSIPNLFYIRLVYLEIMREHCPDLATMFYFDSLVRLVVYGDDLIMSVDDSIAQTFNAVSIQKYLANHGIQVTPAQKDQEMVPYTSIYEATFLKRSFKEHPTRAGIWLGPIDTTSIEECINWCHVSENDQEALLESCRSSLDLAYSQGPQYYTNHYNKIKRALNEIGLTIEYKSWATRDNEIFGESSSKFEPTSIKCKIPWFYDLAKESL